MTNAAKERPWLCEVGKRDLSDIHHALRMLIKFPGVGADEMRLLTNLADACWNEYCRRTGEKISRAS